MKYLIWLLLALLGGWWWRKRTQQRRPQAPTAAQQNPSVYPMVSCQVCNIHLPADTALVGRLGAYCSAEHRDQHES